MQSGKRKSNGRNDENARTPKRTRVVSLAERFAALPGDVQRQIANDLNYEREAALYRSKPGSVYHNVSGGVTGKLYAMTSTPPLSKVARVREEKKLQRIVRSRGTRLGNEQFAFLLSTTGPAMKKATRDLVSSFASSRPSTKEILDFLKNNMRHMKYTYAYRQGSRGDPDFVPMILDVLSVAKPWGGSIMRVDEVGTVLDLVSLTIPHAIDKYRHDPQGMRRVADIVEMIARTWPKVADDVYETATDMVFATLVAFMEKWKPRSRNYFVFMNRRALSSQTYTNNKRGILESALRAIAANFTRRLGLEGNLSKLGSHPRGVQWRGNTFKNILYTNDPKSIAWYVKTFGIDVNRPFTPSDVFEDAVQSWFEYAYVRGLERAMLALVREGYKLRINRRADTDAKDDANRIRDLPASTSRTALENVLLAKHPHAWLRS